jgi:hypothetical protein
MGNSALFSAKTLLKLIKTLKTLQPVDNARTSGQALRQKTGELRSALKGASFHQDAGSARAAAAQQHTNLDQRREDGQTKKNKKDCLRGVDAESARPNYRRHRLPHASRSRLEAI